MPLADAPDWRRFIPRPGDLYRQPASTSAGGDRWWLLIECSHHMVCDWSSEPDKRRADYEFIMFRPGSGYPPWPIREQLCHLRGYLISGIFELVSRGESGY
jgi:hypothetical protein